VSCMWMPPFMSAADICGRRAPLLNAPHTASLARPPEARTSQSNGGGWGGIASWWWRTAVRCLELCRLRRLRLARAFPSWKCRTPVRLLRAVQRITGAVPPAAAISR
jgi:hypothetical protein